MFRNLSYTMTDRKLAQPNKLLAASLMLIYGDISNSEWHSFRDARYDVGPLPMLLPNRMTSFSFTPTT